MKINLSNAVTTFYANPSLEQVYFEAVANAVDAGATEVLIEIDMKSYDCPETLEVKVSDNGIGFTNDRFTKFSSLMETDTEDHKGLGRLVYLAYFNEVVVQSCYGKKKREFRFDRMFDGKSEVSKSEDSLGSELHFSSYLKQSVYSYDYVVPDRLKDRMLRHFLPLMFNLRSEQKTLEIKISLNVEEENIKQDFISGEASLSLNDVPQFREDVFSDDHLGIMTDVKVCYCLENDIRASRKISSVICVDQRTIDIDLVPSESIPHGWQMTFLFFSDIFIGKSDTSRQKLSLPEDISGHQLKSSLCKAIGRIIRSNVPEVDEENKRIQNELDSKYPHLIGMYPKDYAGLIRRGDALSEAQRKFFEREKVILECEELDDERFEQAVDLSSRVLMEYVLYRSLMIERMKELDFSKSEGEIHDLICPRSKAYRETGPGTDCYSNNVWILDDKFMTYKVVLSDKEMRSVVKEISLEEETDQSRPDLVLVFSADPKEVEKVSVVVVELKKHGIKLAKNEEVVSQLKARARRLYKLFPDKIERMWFYGITEIDEEFECSLIESEFKELYSCGKVFYKSQKIVEMGSREEFPVDLCVMTYDALMSDAESRNSAFISVLKNAIRSFVKREEEKMAEGFGVRNQAVPVD